MNVGDKVMLFRRSLNGDDYFLEETIINNITHTGRIKLSSLATNGIYFNPKTLESMGNYRYFIKEWNEELYNKITYDRNRKRMLYEICDYLEKSNNRNSITLEQAKEIASILGIKREDK